MLLRLQPIDSCMARNISFITLDHLQSIHYTGSSVKNVVHSRDGFSIRSYNFGVIEAGASILGPTSLMSTPSKAISSRVAFVLNVLASSTIPFEIRTGKCKSQICESAKATASSDSDE